VRLGFVEGDSDTADKYPVSLRAQGSADLVLWNATAYEQARAYAKALAELLRFDVEDASTDQAVRASCAATSHVRRMGAAGSRATWTRSPS
jgi:hypothetical protein